jgi:hypothetical protein
MQSTGWLSKVAAPITPIPYPTLPPTPPPPPETLEDFPNGPGTILSKMLSKIADNYDSEVDATVSGLTALLEPILIISMGLVVGFIVVALFQPMISMMTQLTEQQG